MKKLLILMVIGVVCVTTIADQTPQASEVLERYLSAENKFNSFILKSEVSRDGGNTALKITGGRPDYRLNDLRFDGNRMSLRLTLWGQVRLNGPSISRDDAGYTSYLWDGDKLVSNSKSIESERRKNPPAVIIRNRKDVDESLHLKGLMPGAYMGSYTLGYTCGDCEKVGSILRRAKSLELREDMETVGGVQCHVLEAKVAGYGEYTLWIDPEHGYNIAKAEVIKKKNDYFHGRTGWSASSSMDNVRFEEIDGQWVIVEADIKVNTKMHEGQTSWEKRHFKLIEILFDPDHESLQSFTMDDVDNGSKVHIVGLVGISYTWKDGEIVPNVDEIIVDELDKVVDRMELEGETPSALTASELTAHGLLHKYRMTQDRLKSFVAKAENEIRARGSAALSRGSTEFKTDGLRVSFRSSNAEGKEAYASFLWDGKSLTEYSRGSEPEAGKGIITQDEDKKNRLIASEYRGAPLLGICPTDLEPVDSIAKGADKLVLRKTKEKVNESDCYVIDADTERGKYTLWIDPNHDYHIAKMIVKKRKGDIIYSRGRIQSAMTFTLDNVRFERISDIWVPIEADMEQTGPPAEKWHHKRTEFLLNPDHDALKSFAPDDIPNGAEVTIIGKSGKYRWADGKPQEVK